MRSRSLLPLVLVLFAAVSARAHHGWSGYDEKNPRTLSGTVTESSWGNPHGTLVLKTADATWKVILAPVKRMKDRGLTPAMVAKGATVTVMGFVHKEHAGELRAERITVGDKTTELR
jgi:hypothetical protein